MLIVNRKRGEDNLPTVTPVSVTTERGITLDFGDLLPHPVTSQQKKKEK
ncbi:unnamed protein product, partial [Staurois parvus]